MCVCVSLCQAEELLDVRFLERQNERDREDVDCHCAVKKLYVCCMF